MTDLGIKYKLVKPSNTGKSDKYSKQIYAFLKKNGERYFNGKTPYVYYTHWVKQGEPTPVIDMEFFLQLQSNGEVYTPNIMIGQKQSTPSELIGTHLNSITGYRPSYSIGCYVRMDRYIMLDISDWFWEEYLKIGRCIYDVHHNSWLNDSDTRFATLGKTKRFCTYCGAVQKRIKEKKVTVTERWVNV